MSETQVTERTSLASRVRAGVALLDQEAPGWWQRIDLDTFDMRLGGSCVVGQGVDGFGYPGKLTNLGIRTIPEEVSLGFFSSRGYDGLTRLWAYVVRTRQAVAQ